MKVRSQCFPRPVSSTGVVLPTTVDYRLPPTGYKLKNKSYVIFTQLDRSRFHHVILLKRAVMNQSMKTLTFFVLLISTIISQEINKSRPCTDKTEQEWVQLGMIVNGEDIVQFTKVI